MPTPTATTPTAPPELVNRMSPGQATPEEAFLRQSIMDASAMLTRAMQTPR